MVEVIAVPPERIEELWPTLKPFVDEALEYSFGESDASHVKESASRGEVQFLLFVEGKEILAAVSCELVEHPLKRVANIYTAAGKKMEKWLDLWWETMQKLAKEQGADTITIHGRKGWERALSKYGFERKYTVLARGI